MPSGNLQIVNASQEDEGTYKCAAYNPVTQEVKTSVSSERLRVRRKPLSFLCMSEPFWPWVHIQSTNKVCSWDRCAFLGIYFWCHTRKGPQSFSKNYLLHARIP